MNGRRQEIDSLPHDSARLDLVSHERFVVIETLYERCLLCVVCQQRERAIRESSCSWYTHTHLWISFEFWISVCFTPVLVVLLRATLATHVEEWTP